MSDSNKQIDLLDKVSDKLNDLISLEESKYCITGAIKISGDVKQKIKVISSECYPNDCIDHGYLYRSNLKVKKSYISYKTLEDLLSQRSGETISPVTSQKAPTWCTLALFVGFFGWKGFKEGLTIEKGIEKFPSNRNPKKIEEGSIEEEHKGKIILQYLNITSIYDKLRKNWRVVLLFLFASIILIIGSFFIANTIIPKGHFPDGKEGILVFKLDGDINKEIQKDLIRTLNESFDDTLNIVVHPYNEAVSIDLGNQVAHDKVSEIGKDYTNTFCGIWGSVRTGKKSGEFKYHLRLTFIDKLARHIPTDFTFSTYRSHELDIPNEFLTNTTFLVNNILGLKYVYQDNPEIALKHLNKIDVSIIKSKESLANYYSTRALCHYKIFFKNRDSHQLDLVLEESMKAIVANPTSHLGDLYFSMYWLLYESDKNAIDNSFEMNPLLDKRSFFPYLKKGLHQYFNSEFKSAIENIHIASTKIPNCGLCEYYAGLTYLEIGMKKEAIESFLNATSFESNYNLAYNMLGDIYLEQEDYEQSLNYYLQSYYIEPLNFRTIRKIGNVYFLMNNRDIALKYYLEADSLKKNDLEGLALIGLAYRYIGNILKSIEYYKKANNVDTLNQRFSNDLGELYSMISLHDSSIFYFKKALRNKPTDVKTLETLGDEYYSMEQYSNAIIYYSSALQSNDSSYNLWHKMGNSYFLNSNLDSCIYSYLHAKLFAESDTSKAITDGLIGIAYFSNMDTKNAITHYANYLSFFPSDILAREKISLSYIMNGDFEMAKENAYHLLNSTNNHRGYMLLGHISYLENSLSQAIISYRKSLELYSDSNIFFNRLDDDYYYFLSLYDKAVISDIKMICKKISPDYNNNYEDSEGFD